MTGMNVKDIFTTPSFLLMLLIFIGFAIGFTISLINTNYLYYIEQLNYLVIHGYYYELITSIFVTSSVVDFVFNFLSMYIIYLIFGSRAKRNEYGIFLFSGILGNIFTVFFYGPFTLSSGASGGIFGILAYYTFYDFISGGNLGVYGLIFLIAVFGISDIFFPNVNVYAHVGGIIGGIIYAAGYYLLKHSRKVN